MIIQLYINISVLIAMQHITMYHSSLYKQIRIVFAKTEGKNGRFLRARMVGF